MRTEGNSNRDERSGRKGRSVPHGPDNDVADILQNVTIHRIQFPDGLVGKIHSEVPKQVVARHEVV